ncbi:MAG: monoamine oxidase [Crocinitomix sp.]|jgi:monoamine oxidase
MTEDKVDYRQLAEELYLPRNLKGGTKTNQTIEGYLDVLDNGLKGTADKSKEVIVVGAGIAGMLSAILLADYGHKVTILEANDDRVGGRVKTFGQTPSKSPFSKGQYAEAGAMRFPSKHPLVMAYITKYNLEKQEFFNVSVDNPSPEEPIKPVKVNNTFLRTNSFQERRFEYDKAPKITNKGFYEGGVAPEVTAGTLLDNALDSARDYYSELDPNPEPGTTAQRYDFDDREKWINGWARLIKDFDKYSLGGYLREVAGLSEGDIGLIGTLENLSARMPLSFMHSFLGRSDINPGNTYYELKGGSWQLTEVLHNIIKSHANITIKMAHRMTHIDCAEPNFIMDLLGKINYANKAEENISIRTINEKSIENEAVTGDICIITIPFSSLRFVRTTPDFSYGKRRAIIELHYDAATKVLLEFDKRWWEWTEEEWGVELKILLEHKKITVEEYDAYMLELTEPMQNGGRPALHAFGGGSMTDSPNRAMYYPSHQAMNNSVAVPGGVILASYTWSDDARRWDSMDDEDRYDFALRGLTYVHGNKILPFFSGKKQGEWIKEGGEIKTGAATQSWARNPYAFGEAAVFQAYQFTNLHPNIPTPEGHVFFAGEHTSLKHAWVEGSLESAIRVAQEVKQETDQS